MPYLIAFINLCNVAYRAEAALLPHFRDAGAKHAEIKQPVWTPSIHERWSQTE